MPEGAAGGGGAAEEEPEEEEAGAEVDPLAAAAEVEVPLERVEKRGAAEEEGSPSGISEEVEGPDGSPEREWTGFPGSSASSERGSVKAEGGSASGQENLESSLSLASMAWSKEAHGGQISP